MPAIEHLSSFQHDGLPGVRVFPVTASLAAGHPQEVLVEVDGDGTIPLHTHSVDAKMVIVAGSGCVLSAQSQLNGVPVRRGDVVRFEKDIAHGFEAGPDGLVFLSVNGGIVDSRSENWDIRF
jgi:quercetin dioxygenase-like cupin family protein